MFHFYMFSGGIEAEHWLKMSLTCYYQALISIKKDMFHVVSIGGTQRTSCVPKNLNSPIS